MPRSSDGVKSVSPRRHQTFVTVPFEHDPVGVDEDRVVGAAPPRLRLGGHVHRVARRLHAGEQPRRRGAHAEQRDRASRRARARPRSSRARSLSERERRRDARPPGRPSRRGGATRRRRTPSGARGRRAPASRRRSTAGSPMLAAEAVEPVEVRVEPERPAGVDAQRLERGAAAQERLVVGADDRLVGSTRPRPVDGEREHASRDATGLAAAATPIGRRAAARAFDPRLLDLGRRLGVPDDAAADPEVDRARRRPRTCGSSARGRSRRSP